MALEFTFATTSPVIIRNDVSHVVSELLPDDL